MKIVYNKWIPFSGFFAINLFGVLFIREENRYKDIDKITYNHENIHTSQMLDFVRGNEKLLIIGGLLFYMVYFIEWFIKLIITGFTLGRVKAYKSISFEQEAYTNQYNLLYLEDRKSFSWTNYIFKLVK